MTAPFVGTGIYVRGEDGEVSMRGAVGIPWSNELELRQWINPRGCAGPSGVHFDVIADGWGVFGLVLNGVEKFYPDAYLGPYTFGQHKKGSR